MNDNDTITVLRGPDRVRKRPAVAFDTVGEEGVTNALTTLLRIFVNEAALGFCKKIAVTIDANNVVSIKSYDRGFRLSEENVDGKPSWEWDFCELATPPAQVDEDYILTVGERHNTLYGDDTTAVLQGEGDAFFDLACVQFVSDFMEVAVSRDGVLKTLGFQKGYCTKRLQKQPTDDETYTSICLKIDAEVFGTDAVSADAVGEYLQVAAITVAGLTCELTDRDTSMVFCYPQGLADYANAHMNGKQATPLFVREITASGKDRYDRREYTAVVKVAVCFCKEERLVRCFHNRRALTNGGLHLDSVNVILTQYARWMLGDVDLAKHLVLLVETRCDGFATRWVDATRTALANPMIADMTADTLDEDFRYYLKSNKEQISAML